ncbi:hypothetical protein ACFQZC_33405 [Streptacidiphilus monticola]
MTAACLAMVFQPILQPTGPGHTSPVDLFTLATLLLTGVWAATSGRRLGAPTCCRWACWSSAAASPD